MESMNTDAAEKGVEGAEGWPAPGGGRGERFAGRTVRGIASLFRDTIFSQEHAERAGLMQALDPRVKLATVLAAVVAISFIRHPAHILALYILTLALAAASRIPLGFFVKRVWFFIPLFSGIIALPALVMVPGRAILHVARIGTVDINVTAQGLESAVMFVLRVAASVSFVVLLGLTTRWTRLLGALRSLRVPAVFVLILGITYRFIFYLLELVGEMHAARVSRTLEPADGVEGRRWAAGRMGFAMMRAVRIGDSVYEAMASRGFTGDARIVSGARAGAPDALWAAGAALVFVIVFLLGGFR